MKYIVHTDGAARGNPGPAAIGVVIEDEDGRTVYEASRALGVRTNNEAEYQALITALDFAFGLCETPFPDVGCTDGPLLFRTEP